MNMYTETVEEQQKVLIVSKKDLPINPLLKQMLQSYKIEVYISPRIPIAIDRFQYCFIIDETVGIEKIASKPGCKIILLYTHRSKFAEWISKKNLSNVKIVLIYEQLCEKEDIEKILWFAFSKSKESFLKIRKLDSLKEGKKDRWSFPRLDLSWLKKKNVLIPSMFVVISLFLTLFVIPLLSSSLFLYRAVQTIRQERFDETNYYLDSSTKLLRMSKILYSFPRPIYLFFSSSLFPDNIIELQDKTQSVLHKILVTRNNIQEIIKLFLNKNKSENEMSLFSLRINSLRETAEELEDELTIIYQKIPQNITFLKKYKEELFETLDLISKAKKIIPSLETLLAKNTEKHYLLLFANNMELRPGGGFIGSFGIITVKDFTLMDFKIYDVYDADGQLIAHMEPPTYIRTYLQQPHWFLRDSATSADFLENYAQAKFFLEKEMNLKDFSGAILLTTTGIEHILAAYGDIRLPDFDELVNQKNFYLKAQTHAEKNFFPGSTQKKGFLSSLTKQLLMKLNEVSFPKLLSRVKNALDEKQLVLYLDEPNVQEVIDSFYWSGRLIQAKCQQQMDNCTTDYFFPLDSNLGVNKANFFLSRLIKQNIVITSKGEIKHVLSIVFKNNSPGEVFPGGIYRNYFQAILPKNIILKQILKNGVLVEKYEKTEDQLTTLGFYFEIKPKTSEVIQIEYSLESTLQKGKGSYQFVVQKQIGTFNNDFSLEISLPNNIYLLNQNFSPLVQDNKIIYNTQLSTDKIFFVEFIKE